MESIAKNKRKINIEELLQKNVPLAPFTTFKVGGPAEYYSCPKNEEELKNLLIWAKEKDIPYHVLGEGANILISDRGIPGLVIHTKMLTALDFTSDMVTAGAGWDVSDFISNCSEKEVSSLEFLYGMPSSIGGAVWMNARCYGSEISQKFISAKVLTSDLEWKTIRWKEKDWAYKKSPFQDPGLIIVNASFRTENRSTSSIQAEMEEHRSDREKKGHFKKPCAGSFFKNNRSFGQPTGQIIDELGLKGLSLGGAQISPWHGNILINRSGATAKDIWELGQLVRKKVYKAKGFDLEPEVIPVGLWEEG